MRLKFLLSSIGRDSTATLRQGREGGLGDEGRLSELSTTNPYCRGSPECVSMCVSEYV